MLPLIIPIRETYDKIMQQQNTKKKLVIKNFLCTAKFWNKKYIRLSYFGYVTICYKKQRIMKYSMGKPKCNNLEKKEM